VHSYKHPLLIALPKAKNKTKKIIARRHDEKGKEMGEITG